MDNKTTIIAYDISNTKMRNKLIKILKRFGGRMQYSIFIFDLTAEQTRRLVEDVKEFYHNARSGSAQTKDKLRIAVLPLCPSCFSHNLLLGGGLPDYKNDIIL